MIVFDIQLRLPLRPQSNRRGGWVTLVTVDSMAHAKDVMHELLNDKIYGIAAELRIQWRVSKTSYDDAQINWAKEGF